MVWKADFEIGITLIDEQHKKLVEMLSELNTTHEPINEMTGKVIKEMVEYVKVHFKDEEAIMKRIGFTEYHSHKKLHQNLVNEIAAILVDLKNGKEITNFELRSFLERWLIDHILIEDRRIGLFLGSTPLVA